MRKKAAQVEWLFPAEDEYEQVITAPQDISPAARSAQRTRRLLWLAALLIPLSATLAALYRSAQQGVDALVRDVQAAAEADAWHMPPSDTAAPDAARGQEATLDAAASPAFHWLVRAERQQLADVAHGAPPTVHIDPQRVCLEGEIAVAEVTLSLPGAPTRYRQTRFYHRAAEGWLRTQPSPALWGEPRQLATDHLLWTYRARDQQVVEAAAQAVDRLYVQLRRDLALGPPPTQDPLVIDLRVDALPGRIHYRLAPTATLVLPSPAAYLAPAHLTDADLLMQAAGLALVQIVRVQAAAAYGLDSAWPLVEGIGLWQIWAMDLGLSEWQDDLIRWAYAERQDAPTVRLPAAYAELCMAHRLWLSRPTLIGIPLDCNDSDTSAARALVLRDSPNRLALGEPTERLSAYYRTRDLDYDLALRQGRILYQATVVDYIVATYGREHLPALITALDTHDTWATLLPARLGVDKETFEQGWRRHVARLARD